MRQAFIAVDILTFRKYNDNMDTTLLKTMLANNIRTFRLPKYEQLPDMGLYLEQVTAYLNSQLAPLGCIEITGSMIRNYVKKGLIANPVKKRYYADHIAHLFAICLLKYVMSLENIHALFVRQRQVYSIQVAYDYLGEEMENTLWVQFGLKAALAEIGITSSIEKQMLRSAIIALSNIIYLNGCFRLLSQPREDTPPA